MTIFLVEDIIAQPYLGDLPRGVGSVFALTPEGAYALDRLGVSYEHLEDATGDEVSYLLQSHEVLRRADARIKFLVEKATGRESPAHGPIWHHLYYTKMIYDGAGFRLKRVQAVLRGVRDVEVILFTARRPESVRRPSYVLDHTESIGYSYYPDILEYLQNQGRLKRVEVRVLERRSSQKKKAVRLDVRGHLKDFLHRLRYLCNCSSHRNQKTVLFLEEPNLLGQMICEDQLGCRPVDIRNRVEKIQEDDGILLGYVLEEMLEDQTFLDCFRLEDLNLLGFIQNKMKDLLVDFYRFYPAAEAFVDRMMVEYSPSYIFAGVRTDFRLSLLGDLFRERGVQTIGAQHGGGYGYGDFSFLGNCEYCRSDIFYGFTSHTNSDFLSKYCLPEEKRPEFRILDKPPGFLFPKAGTGRETPKTGGSEQVRFLYAPTNFGLNLFRFAGHCVPDSLYYSAQKILVDALLSQPYARLIYKPHPLFDSKDNNPIVRYLEERGAGSSVLRIPFSEAIDASDVIVIDAPWTTLLQALTTSKPIFVLIYRLYTIIDHLAQIKLKQRAFVYEDMNEMVRAFLSYLENPHRMLSQVDLEDKSFFCTYISESFLDNGLEVRRAPM